MDKQQLIEALGDRFAAVGTPQLQNDPLGSTTKYLVKVLDVNGDSAVEKNVLFYVVNEGQPTEVAYWQRDPKPPPRAPGFEQRLRTKIAEAVSADQIVAAFVGDIDSQTERAIVTIVTESGGNYTRRERVAWLDKDGEGNDVLRHQLIS